jgi:hypothetical protein
LPGGQSTAPNCRFEASVGVLRKKTRRHRHVGYAATSANVKRWRQSTGTNELIVGVSILEIEDRNFKMVRKKSQNMPPLVRRKQYFKVSL